MPRNRKYSTLEECYAERNKRRRERAAAIKSEKEKNPVTGISTVAVTAIAAIHDTDEQPNESLDSLIRETLSSSFTVSERNHDEASTSNIPNSATERPQRRQKTSLDILQSIATEATKLPDSPNCVHCGAKRFHLEPPGFCCASGEIQLVQTEMPRELMDLYLDNSAEAQEFRKCVRSYNNMFAFTSIGMNCDKSLAQRNNGVYTFKVQGQMYHFINQLVPEDGEHPRNLQLYFFDTDHETTNRMTISSKFKETLIQKLSDILKINPYSAFFCGLQELPNIEDYKIVLESNPRLDQRIYNKPIASQVGAVWIENDDTQQVQSKHIQVYGKNGKTQILKHYFGCYDSLQYPLIFAHGEQGWHPGIERLVRGRNGFATNNTCPGDQSIRPEACQNADDVIDAENQGIKKKRKRQTVSCREYYCYKLQIRPNDRSMLLHVGRLLQQYVVDVYIKMETSRLDFFRNQDKQKRLRTELYQGLLDSFSKGETFSSNVGKRIILPSSFIGGPRDMRRRYMDAMSLVQRFGKPDIFLTMTCNQNWPEIKDNLLTGQLAQNRPDLVSRVFRAKLEVLKNELLKKNIFGKIAAYTYVVEFQKRGLPHAHFLIILKPSSKIYSLEAYDKIVSAEIPDSHLHPHLHALVAKHMMHGPCGNLNPTCPCMRKNNGCKNGYPKNFVDNTQHGENSYPVYRRRDDKKFVKVRGCNLDNRWVVPYNAYLLSRFNCHMNVEICSTIQAVKYIYKYIYKGHDRIMYHLTPEQTTEIIDELKNFQSARWVSPPEAMWRIYAFDLNEIHPSVISLPIHLENQHPVAFPENQSLKNIVANTTSSRTMLTEFFHMNRHDTHAKNLNCLYNEFPEQYVWDPSAKCWSRRKQRQVIGRIVCIHPSEGERYYLRMLLMHIRKPTSFDDLKTVNGHLTNSFQEAAQLLGLLQLDNNAEYCLQEAILYQMPSSLRQLFATILIHCIPKNPTEFWLKYKDFLCEDMLQNKGIPRHMVEISALQIIDSHLRSMGKTLATFNLDSLITHQDKIAREIEVEKNIIVPPEDILAINQLNPDQQHAYNQILAAVKTNSSTSFFIDGPAGTGKTFLYRSLLASVRKDGKIALATATSGVAASLLPGGRTAHSQFKIPLRDDDTTVCNISKQSVTAQLIKDSKLIIWDEATMANRKAVEKFDQLMRDIMNNDMLFGGKVVVFGGDFRQTLPVVSKGQREDIIDASLVMSPLWSHLVKLKLRENMRARLDTSFCDFLLRIGDGNEPTTCEGEIEIPSPINVPFTDENSSVDTLLDMVFPDLNRNSYDISTFMNRAVLTTRNDFVHDINESLIEKFPGSEKIYLSFDEMLHSKHTPENSDLVHSLTPNGLPPHRLQLKKNCPIMLLRNLNPAEGLSNGTRLICRDFANHVIFAEIAFGAFAGRLVFIPRIPLQSSDNDFCSIPFKRTQFPIRLCFAMTINKSQGQTLDFVGLYLKEPVFTHGQLYVALSRAKTTTNVKVLIRPVNAFSDATNLTKNVVYTEVLSSVFSTSHAQS